MIDGLYLQLYCWPTALKSDVQKNIEMLVPATLSLIYLYAFNTFIIRLDHLKLGAALGLSALLYTYIVKLGADALADLSLLSMDYPHNIISVILVILSILSGFILSKRSQSRL